MSSLAGLWGTALVAPYGATKAFDFNLAEALHHELKDKGIDVMACCAGATDTPNYRATKPNYGFLRPPISSPSEVAEAALSRLGKSALFIPGFYNQLTYFLFSRILGRSAGVGVMNRTMKKMYSR
jgi:short-subunit dehydrogenase